MDPETPRSTDAVRVYDQLGQGIVELNSAVVDFEERPPEVKHAFRKAFFDAATGMRRCPKEKAKMGRSAKRLQSWTRSISTPSALRLCSEQGFSRKYFHIYGTGVSGQLSRADCLQVLETLYALEMDSISLEKTLHHF